MKRTPGTARYLPIGRKVEMAGSITVRLPVTMVKIIDDYADMHGFSRNVAMADLIGYGLTCEREARLSITDPAMWTEGDLSFY